MQLIIDSGSSKTNWAYVQKPPSVQYFTSGGINPSTQSRTYIHSTLMLAAQHFSEYDVTEIQFYGAGCKNQAAENLKLILQNCFPKATIFVHNDLLGAARATCQGNNGIVCILGTGSHSCLSDGHHILHQRPSLGYLLGDEGSGNHLGKILLKKFYYGQLSASLTQQLLENFPELKEHFLPEIYMSKNTSSELAKFVPFIKEFEMEPTIATILNEAFQLFFVERILPYQDKKNWPIYFIGSVGFVFQQQLNEILITHGFLQPIYLQNPLDSLINYHLTYVGN
ncbi:MAG: hypothetical protein M3Q56_10115 [Bacteroidota bacterium]|nr:hypothetical protein [Bacteroidota bacterium]